MEDREMDRMSFIFNIYRIQLRMIFGGKHRYRKEYDTALDILEERGHWLYLYDSLEGPKADQVVEALQKWTHAYQAKAPNEKELKRELHVLIYGKNYREGWQGHVE